MDNDNQYLLNIHFIVIEVQQLFSCGPKSIELISALTD